MLHVTVDAERLALQESARELDDVLHGYFARRVPAADVDDLVQECRLRVVDGLAALQDRERLGPWIFRIAERLVVDHARRKRRQPVSLDAPELVVARGADDASVVVEVGLAAWLARMVDRLPPHEANAVRAAELEGRPHREIAAELGVTVSAVKSRVVRGRARLRRMFEACCAAEFDRRGRVRDVTPHRPDACGC